VLKSVRINLSPSVVVFMSTGKIIECQDKIGELIMQEAPDDWRILRINAEMLYSDDNIDGYSLMAYCYKGELLEDDINYLPSRDFGMQLYKLLIKLNNLFLEQGERWTVCDFVISHTGKYKLQFSYNAPPRLNGNMSDGENDPRPSIEPYT
jgi:hypothetical protein